MVQHGSPWLLARSVRTIIGVMFLAGCALSPRTENAASAAAATADANLDVDHHRASAERQADDERLNQLKGEPFILRKVTVASLDGLAIPLYEFTPRQAPVQAALVWIYGGIHDRFGTNYLPFIREAVARGYAVVAPEYRGAMGYGADFYDALDYGGGEVDDALAAAAYAIERYDLNSYRLGILGWSHGGLIALLAAAEAPERFGAIVASVPVSNLVLRMASKGPSYQALFTGQEAYGAPVHRHRKPYVERSPFYRVDDISAPIHVQFATNDDDVDWIEAQTLAYRLATMPNAEVLVFDSPPGGHYFNRSVDLETLQRKDTPEQIDSWNAINRFLDTHLLQPDELGSFIGVPN